MKGHKQTTDGVGYETEYAYNLSGAMVEQRYPSGRVVKNAIDNNGDLSMVQSARCMDAAASTDADCTAQAGLWNYAKNFTYNPAGAVASMQLGNGRWESTAFNSRLQPTQIALGATPNATNLLKLDYSYGEWNGTTLDGTKNNGNVAGQVITVKRPGQSDLVFDQKYGYDMLNRITSAEEKTGATVNWNQTYTFDRYGNRNFNESLTTTLPKGCVDGSTAVVCEADKKMLNPDLNASDNRMATGQGWSYDAAGNVIADPQGRSFVYDAENKQVEVENSLEQSIGSYWFDGDGKRIKKEGLAPNGQPELTVFVYDAGGTLIGEYSTAIETAAPKVQYLTADHLGSPRINTDQNGTVTSRTDYLPYGEEITALGGRSPNENYSPDDIRKGFTGYESDAETGLEFAQARMFSTNLGRFTGSDPIKISTDRLFTPQMINLYVYAVNNPMKYIDPSGEENIQLGREEEDRLRAQIERLQESLSTTDDPTVSDQIGALQARLSFLQEANIVVGAWLDSLRSTGQDGGLQLSDIMLSTDPGNDVTASFRAKYDEEGVNSFIEAASRGGIEGSVMDGKIWIPINSETYQQASGRGDPNKETFDTNFRYGDITKTEINAYAGTLLKHENDHRVRDSSDEVRAYRAQLKSHKKSRNFYSTKGLYKARKRWLKERIKIEKREARRP